MKQFISIGLISLFSIITTAQEDFTKYVDPTIGNVAPFLVPTYPTIQLPNQMLRMYPRKKDYLSDQVEFFPFQVTAHRNKGIFQIRVSLGQISNESWKNKMNIDHDLEIVKPWFYSTYLIDDDIRVSFTPGKKTAIYKIEFPKDSDKNILIKGSNDMTSASSKNSPYSFEEKLSYTTRGTRPVTRVMSAYVYSDVTDEEGQIIENATVLSKEGKFSLSIPKEAPSTVLIKYAISYISAEQAKINYEKELSSASFDQLVDSGKKQWEKVINPYG
jgi:putative alpha-1,2-mannosidase